ncbi:MAG: cytidine deaminase, partial [Bacteroidota bacterium]
KAYAPYSKFCVGAAIFLENGEVVTGSNQENASYPSGLCAERTALFYAGANYPNQEIKSIAITAASSNETTTEPIPPCGACRQVIAEYEDKQQKPIEIFFMGEVGKIAKSYSLANLLPFVFKGRML